MSTEFEIGDRVKRKFNRPGGPLCRGTIVEGDSQYFLHVYCDVCEQGKTHITSKSEFDVFWEHVSERKSAFINKLEDNLSIAKPEEDTDTMVDYQAAQNRVADLFRQSVDAADDVVLIEEHDQNNFYLFVTGDIDGAPVGVQVIVASNQVVEGSVKQRMSVIKKRRELGEQVDEFNN